MGPPGHEHEGCATPTNKWFAGGLASVQSQSLQLWHNHPDQPTRVQDGAENAGWGCWGCWGCSLHQDAGAAGAAACRQEAYARVSTYTCRNLSHMHLQGLLPGMSIWRSPAWQFARRRVVVDALLARCWPELVVVKVQTAPELASFACCLASSDACCCGKLALPPHVCALHTLVEDCSRLVSRADLHLHEVGLAC